MLVAVLAPALSWRINALTHFSGCKMSGYMGRGRDVGGDQALACLCWKLSEAPVDSLSVQGMFSHSVHV